VAMMATRYRPIAENGAAPAIRLTDVLFVNTSHGGSVVTLLSASPAIKAVMTKTSPSGSTSAVVSVTIGTSNGTPKA
jgi:hypothetical protein